MRIITNEILEVKESNIFLQRSTQDFMKYCQITARGDHLVQTQTYGKCRVQYTLLNTKIKKIIAINKNKKWKASTFGDIIFEGITVLAAYRKARWWNYSAVFVSCVNHTNIAPTFKDVSCEPFKRHSCRKASGISFVMEMLVISTDTKTLRCENMRVLYFPAMLRVAVYGSRKDWDGVVRFHRAFSRVVLI